MDASENDYLIFSDPNKPKKNHLMQVKKKTSDGYKGILEHDRHLEEKYITAPEEDILVNLGDSPKPGIIYGVDVRDIYKKSLEIDGWGDIYFFITLDKPIRKALYKALESTYSIISKNKLDPLFDKLCMEIRTARGKYAGMYKHSSDKTMPSRVKLFLKEDHAQQMEYVLLHEFGHAIWFHCLKNPKIQSVWLHLFNTSILVEPVSETSFSKMFKLIRKSDAASLSIIRSQFGDDDEKEIRVLKTAIRFISQVHKVKPREVSTLMEAGKFDTLQEIWPQRDIDVNDLQPIVSEYATRNVGELFAESVAFYFTKKKLPKSVHSLLEKSLSVAKDTVKTLGVEE